MIKKLYTCIKPTCHFSSDIPRGGPCLSLPPSLSIPEVSCCGGGTVEYIIQRQLRPQGVLRLYSDNDPTTRSDKVQFRCTVTDLSDCSLLAGRYKHLNKKSTNCYMPRSWKGAILIQISDPSWSGPTFVPPSLLALRESKSYRRARMPQKKIHTWRVEQKKEICRYFKTNLLQNSLRIFALHSSRVPELRDEHKILSNMQPTNIQDPPIHTTYIRHEHTTYDFLVYLFATFSYMTYLTYLPYITYRSTTQSTTQMNK